MALVERLLALRLDMARFDRVKDAYRRSLHAAIGAVDESLPFYWDWDWYLRVARSGPTVIR